MSSDDRDLPKMSEQEILAQPPEVWHAVEREILRGGYGGRVRQMLQFEHYAEDGRVEPWIWGDIPAGWLTWQRAKELEAVDTPVRQLFFAEALRRKAYP